VAAAVLLASALLAVSGFDGAVASWVPECSARKAGGSCALCGLTRSFMAISRGDFASGSAAHSYGIWIYLAFLLFACGGISAGISEVRRRKLPC
jgi:hypothetical protein